MLFDDKRSPEPIRDSFCPDKGEEEFEEANYIEMKGERCGHRFAGIFACSRCIDACAHHAVCPGQPVPRIDHTACLGCGACVAACPCSAIQLSHPTIEDALHQVSKKTAECPGAPVVVFHENHIPAPGGIPIRFEPIGALGVEMLLATLALGAAGIVILPGPETNRRTLHLLREQVSWCRLMIDALGYPEQAVALLQPGEDTHSLPISPIGKPTVQPRIDQPIDQPKRGLARWAIEQLASGSKIEGKTVVLPAGAPYGAVTVDKTTCTFCMACTSICPTGALSTAGEVAPGLFFKESACIQCGLCVAGCPEKCLKLHPGMHFDAHINETTTCLKKEPPFLCVRCGTPFSTQKMIKTMMVRLADHWMFGTDEEKKRLQMCRTCRIKDMFENRKEREQI